MDTQTLYDKQASNWARRAPNSLSDFTGRPPVFDLCGDVRGLDIVDLGSGEGYCSREMKARGARSVTGIEISGEMVALAKKQEAERPLGIDYLQGDVTQLPFESGRFDLALAVFVFNYLDLDQSLRAMKEIRRAMKPGGTFICSLPHPCFPFMRAPEPPFYFDYNGAGYYAARDKLNEGKIFCRDGKALNVRALHKTFEDVFGLLRDSGFERMPVLRELGVTEEHLKLDPAFFGGVRQTPLHIAIKIEK